MVVEVPAQIFLMMDFAGIMEIFLAEFARKRQEACWCPDRVSLWGIRGTVVSNGGEGLFECDRGFLYCDVCFCWAARAFSNASRTLSIAY